jgi:UDP-N-acetylglucosamine diphosphorylase/glucosamine-1-phosphate N-acetyltransferase
VDVRTVELRTLILAAGKGTRMKSDVAKVLHVLAGRPLLAYVIDIARAVGSDRIVVVIGHQADRVRELFAEEDLVFIEQRELLGTGHAVLQAKGEFSDYGGTVLILCGDVPSLSAATMRSFTDAHRRSKAAVTVLTAVLDNPAGYGRVLKDEKGEIVRIVEDRDATELERQIAEINTGIYCVDGDFLFTALGRITDDNVQHEFYLTDIVHIAYMEGRTVRSLVIPDAREAMGINTPDDLTKAGVYLQERDT